MPERYSREMLCPYCKDKLTKPDKYMRASGARVVGDYPYDPCPRCNAPIDVQKILEGEYDYWPPTKVPWGCLVPIGIIIIWALIVKACP